MDSFQRLLLPSTFEEVKNELGANISKMMDFVVEVG